MNRDVLDTLIQRLTDAGPFALVPSRCHGSRPLTELPAGSPPAHPGLVLNTVAGNQIGAGKDVALEQSFVVLRLPDDGARPVRRLRRRVDIIFAPFEVYWTAVLGWSGSQQFERDIRCVPAGVDFQASRGLCPHSPTDPPSSSPSLPPPSPSRTHANQLEAPLRFNSSGITRLLADGPRRGAHNRPLAIDPAKEEAGVFEALGLVPLRPEERNADC